MIVLINGFNCWNNQCYIPTKLPESVYFSLYKNSTSLRIILILLQKTCYLFNLFTIGYKITDI